MSAYGYRCLPCERVKPRPCSSLRPPVAAASSGPPREANVSAKPESTGGFVSGACVGLVGVDQTVVSRSARPETAVSRSAAKNSAPDENTGPVKALGVWLASWG